MWHKNSEEDDFAGPMNRFFIFELSVILTNIFYYLNSVFTSFDVFYYFYTQNIFLSNQNFSIDFFYLDVLILLLYMSGS